MLVGLTSDILGVIPIHRDTAHHFPRRRQVNRWLTVLEHMPSSGSIHPDATHYFARAGSPRPKPTSNLADGKLGRVVPGGAKEIQTSKGLERVRFQRQKASRDIDFEAHRDSSGL